MLTKVDYTRFPRVPLWRRGLAFGIDFFCVWLPSILLSNGLPGFGIAQIVVFAIAWFILRVLVVYRNQGQSLGRYALDMKAIDARLNRTPGLQVLCQREAVTGFGALLVAIALANSATNAGAVLLVLPLALECGLAITEPERRQAFHDRLAHTLVVPSRRGYSLDLKVKRLLAKARRNVRQ